MYLLPIFRQDLDWKHKTKQMLFEFTIMLAFVVVVALLIRSIPKKDNNKNPEETEQEDNQTGFLIYRGSELRFPDETFTIVLSKHLPYFNRLNTADKEKFLYRLKQFIDIKIFIIHDKSGFREMPILISATAIKLSFGLNGYLLPYFKFIHIFPAEFVSVNPFLRVLAGNVSGSSIRISWKHFLEGYQFPHDGENVGLHEMAHAYYFQNFETGENADKNFITYFPGFNNTGNKVFELEKAPGNDFYSAYALTNFQEFWAESVELFFERPAQLQIAYPDLYKTMVVILNQDPLHS